MSLTVGAPRAPEADLRVRRALQIVSMFNDLLLAGTFTINNNGGLNLTLTLADMPAGVTTDAELAAALAALKYCRPLFDHFVDASTTNTDGTEDDLYSDTLAAGQLAADGAKLHLSYAGSWIGHATATRRIRVYFGGTAILDTAAILVSVTAAWDCRVEIIRVSSSVVRATAVLTSEASPQQVYTTVSEITGLTLANTQIVKITGTAEDTGAAPADITAWLGTILYTPSA